MPLTLKKFLNYDTEFFSLFSALVGINWGLWLLYAGEYSEIFDTSRVYYFFRILFPHWFISTLFLFYGTGHLIAISLGNSHTRRAMLLYGAALWSIVGMSSFIVRLWVPNTGAYLLLGLFCCWSFIRQKGSDFYD
jgi:hypothetical protein